MLYISAKYSIILVPSGTGVCLNSTRLSGSTAHPLHYHMRRLRAPDKICNSNFNRHYLRYLFTKSYIWLLVRIINETILTNVKHRIWWNNRLYRKRNMHLKWSPETQGFNMNWSLCFFDSLLLFFLSIHHIFNDVNEIGVLCHIITLTDSMIFIPIWYLVVEHS